MDRNERAAERIDADGHHGMHGKTPACGHEEEAQRIASEIDTVYRFAPLGMCVLDLNLRYLRINECLARINGIPAEDHIGRTVRELFPADLARMCAQTARRVVETGESVVGIDISGEAPSQPGVIRHCREYWAPLKDSKGRIVALSVIVEEVTESKRMEEELRHYHEELEKRVLERTEELKAKSKELEETNTALRVILNHREKDKTAAEKALLFDLEANVLPHLQKLRDLRAMNAEQQAFLDVAITNVKSITAPLATHLRTFDFTSREMEVISFIREGKTTKDIARLLGTTITNIDRHRYNIRKKLGLNRAGKALRKHLLSLV